MHRISTGSTRSVRDAFEQQARAVPDPFDISF
jgi:hypothetical protein